MSKNIVDVLRLIMYMALLLELQKNGSNEKVTLLGSGIAEVLDAEKILKLNSDYEI
ncbi:4434_t:CDS:2 [Paraglomus brasilianum]|uniref:4434_t:CDS:1 n=1 Tax=Paraglomus brasilianum TaxID=144538 RepID=A0A9N9DIA3_9GLOM|nr:4434_t:CDS:2 [Paraglomus brasilianum]